MLAHVGSATPGHHNDQAKEPGQEGAAHEPSRDPEGIDVGFGIFPSVVEDIRRKHQPAQHQPRRRVHRVVDYGPCRDDRSRDPGFPSDLEVDRAEGGWRSSTKHMHDRRNQARLALGRIEHPIAGDELRAIKRYLGPSCGGLQHRFCIACALSNAHLSFGGFKLGCLNYSFCTETELYARPRCALKTQSDLKVPHRVAGPGVYEQFTPFADLGSERSDLFGSMSERHAFFSNAPFHWTDFD